MTNTPAKNGTQQSPSRNYALDMLRGLCAIAVATFHLDMWMAGSLSPPLKDLLTWCGLYGVSIFFLLSGYSLTIAYQNKFSHTLEYATVAAYFRRRLGRLLPLFIFAVLISAAGKLLVTHKSISLYQLAANVTLLFGFISPIETPVVGGWSIGIEAVFYIFFPLILLMRKRIDLVLAAAIFMTFWISGKIEACHDLEICWKDYIHPANHFVFFAMGIYLRAVVSPKFRPSSGIKFALIATAIFGICIGALGSSDVQLVTGWRRPLFLVASALLILAFADFGCSRLNGTFEYIGRVSYPLYLIHPVVFFGLKPLVESSQLTIIGVIAAIALATVLLDVLFDKPIQAKLIQLGW